MLTGVLVLAVQATLLCVFGQPLIAASGKILFWVGAVLSPDNSQHLSDWYTPSHIIHGVLFYWGLSYVFPRVPVLGRMLLALGAEVSWEVLENTPMVIQHYREQALAQGYAGDSIINSLSDSVAMLVGFFVAHRFAWWAVALLVLLLEGVALYFVRDNLTLNIINLLYPFEGIANWQLGA
jgi:hypothetical protein